MIEDRNLGFGVPEDKQTEIIRIRQELQKAGKNGVATDEISGLLKQVQSGDITLEQALFRARQIKGEQI